MFAHNNVELDYFSMAYVNALLIQNHLGLTNKQITVVTDPHSLEHGKKTIGIRKIHKAFKNISYNLVKLGYEEFLKIAYGTKQ